MSEPRLSSALHNGGSPELPFEARLTPAVLAPDPAARAAAGSLSFSALLKWVFSFPVMLGTLLVGRVFYEGRGFAVDPDMWWHIKVGQDILRTHHFPTTDPYSFTVTGAPWIAYEWLGEVILGFVARLGNVVALDALLIALAGVIMLALYALATLRSGNCKAGFVASLAICSIAFASFNMRPQMFGYLFLILLLIALESFRKGVSWAIWPLPLLFAVWVNTHGSFIIGLGVLVVYLLSGLKGFQLGSIEALPWGRPQRVQMEAVLLCCLAVLPLTPYGTQLAAYPFDMAFGQPLNTSIINEWRPMPFDIMGGKMFLAFIVVFVALQLFFRFTWRLEEFVLVLGGAVMACLHVRFVMLFVPFFTPLFATMLARWLPPYKRAVDRYIWNAALMSAFVLTMVYFRPSREFLEQRVSEAFPATAVRYLDRHLAPGPMWNDYAFGGYLIADGRKVFIDGRADVYERGGVLSDYNALSKLKPGSLSVLDRYGIQSCLVKPDEALTAALLASPNWKRVYGDGTSVLLLRARPLASGTRE
jgi:hypothetical protein